MDDAVKGKPQDKRKRFRLFLQKVGEFLQRALAFLLRLKGVVERIRLFIRKITSFFDRLRLWPWSATYKVPIQRLMIFSFVLVFGNAQAAMAATTLSNPFSMIGGPNVFAQWTR